VSLSPGTRLGPYEVAALIGAGGMGEVYRARDTRLNRDVALKVLPEVFSRDGQRMARFEREAKLLASLNHPNIAAIYGLEESGPIRALVMELVEGPTVAERIASGALPLDEALPIARQVADAVEYAHEHNVMHRDLKPANIKVTAEGVVKVLDFGLAKALSEEPTAEDISNSPTLSMAATRQGVILGTASYMSPEQARGKKVDKRTDVWALGCVLYEMLTGKQAFHGEDVTEILAAVVMKEPAFDALPANTPPAIQTLLRRCLRKDRRERLPDAGAARIEIQEALSAPATAEPVAAARGNGRERVLAVVAAVAIVIAALGWGAFAYFRPAPEETGSVRLLVSPPDGWNLAQRLGAVLAPAPIAVSPDGRRVAFVALDSGGKSVIWIRSLDSLTAQSLTGTEGGHAPFWSPDNRFLGFFAGGKLKKIDIAGGPPITLCDAPVGVGGTWNQDGLIVFTPTNTVTALLKVSAAGGTPTAATDLEQGETRHNRPFFLPDGEHFLYTAVGSTSEVRVFVASLGLSEREFLFNADSTNVVYSQGHLLFLRETTLMAQPFDAQRLELTGDPFPIAEQIQLPPVAPGSGLFSASVNGVLAYQTGESVAGSKLTWFDRTGKQAGVVGEAGLYGDVELSGDGKWATVSIPDQGRATRDLWVYDMARGLKTRFTSDPAAEQNSIWSPDGSRVVFNSRRKGHLDMYQKDSSGAGTEEVLLEDNFEKFPTAWSPDGRSILYVSGAGPTGAGRDLFVLPLSGDRKPIPFLQTQFSENYAQLSPDGRWVSFTSNESGRDEIHVAPFPGPGGRRLVSTAGGAQARWRPDGAEIFYLAPDNKLMVAEVNGRGSSFEVGAVKPLFQTRAVLGSRRAYDVSADGQRFLINTEPEQVVSAPITVVVNWTARLRR